MGTMNYLKDKLSDAAVQARDAADQARQRAGSFAAEHSGRAGGALDKAAAFVNDKTDGKYADKVDKAAGVARKGVDKAAEQAPLTSMEGGGTPMRGGTAGDGTSMSGPLR
ncbi:MAG: antitoxin [Janthinobacterium lividum]